MRAAHKLSSEHEYGETFFQKTLIDGSLICIFVYLTEKSEFVIEIVTYHLVLCDTTHDRADTLVSALNEMIQSRVK